VTDSMRTDRVWVEVTSTAVLMAAICWTSTVLIPSSEAFSPVGLPALSQSQFLIRWTTSSHSAPLDVTSRTSLAMVGFLPRDNSGSNNEDDEDDEDEVTIFQ